MFCFVIMVFNMDIINLSLSLGVTATEIDTIGNLLSGITQNP